MDNMARVVLALEAHDVAEEVMHFLDRSGRARVVATASDDRQLAEAVRQMDPDVVIAQPSLAIPAPIRCRVLLALDTNESVASLRAALTSGANGFYVWPAERDELVTAAAASLASPVAVDRRATVVAVHGARGGVGTTFVATHLAAAMARGGADCVVMDADPVFGDVSSVLGAPTEGVHTIADLLPLRDELTADHLNNALWAHEAGFRVLLAPMPEEAALVTASDLRVIVEGAASSADVVVIHLPRAIDERTLAGFELADRSLEVLSLDVLSFRAATRALEALRPLDPPVGFVVNRASRGEITPGDVVRVFGTSPLAVIPFERAVPRAQDRGRLLPARSRIGRTFERLAAQMLGAR
jgi:pilus assembly protein CpaE